MPTQPVLFSIVGTPRVREAIQRLFFQDLRNHYHERAENAPDESEKQLWLHAESKVV